MTGIILNCMQSGSRCKYDLIIYADTSFAVTHTTEMMLTVTVHCIILDKSSE